MNFDRLKQHSVDNLGSGTDAKEIEALEADWGMRLPEQFRSYLEGVGYAEIFGDEIYSIYEVPDKIHCLGLHWMNKDNEYLSQGFIQFFSNDLDGEFYLHATTGKVYLNSMEREFASSFVSFIDKMLDQ